MSLTCRPPCIPGSRIPCSQALGRSLTGVVLVHSLPSALQSVSLVSDSMRIVSSSRTTCRAPSSTPCLCSRQGEGYQSNLHAPGQGCRQNFDLLLSWYHTSELFLHSTLVPTPQLYRGFKVGDGCLEIILKYANYFIMSLAWNGTSTEWLKAWQAQEWGKRNGIQRDAKFHPPLALQVSKLQGWGRFQVGLGKHDILI